MSSLDLSARRANVTTLRAKATTEDERWICDEFVRLFDVIDQLAESVVEFASYHDVPEEPDPVLRPIMARAAAVLRNITRF